MEYALEKAADGVFPDEEKQAILARKQQFIDAMDNDLNTADAISALFELTREINTMTSGSTLAAKEQIAFAKAAFDERCGVLGLLYQKKENEIPQEILDLVEERAAARKAKDFAKADALRDQITTMGYIVEETRQGTKISKK